VTPLRPDVRGTALQNFLLAVGVGTSSIWSLQTTVQGFLRWLPLTSMGALFLLIQALIATRPTARAALRFRHASDLRDATAVLVNTGWQDGKAAAGSVTMRELRNCNSDTAQFRYHGEYYKLTGRSSSSSGSSRAPTSSVAEPVQPAVLSAKALHVRAAQGGLSSAEVSKLQSEFTANDIRVPVPPLWRMVCERLMRPVVIFELASLVFWVLDGLGIAALLTVPGIIFFESNTASTRRKALEQLRSSLSPPVQLEILRDGQWQWYGAEEIVPGDILKLAPGQAPCDAALLQGSATVGEASLTGESAPVAKFALSPTVEADGNMQQEPAALHTVFGGTEVLTCSEEPVLAVALRTGFQTRQGALVKRALRSQEELRDRDTLKVVLLLAVFAASAVGYLAWSRTDGLWVKAGIMLSFVVRPSLPVLMTFAVRRQLDILGHKDILCTEPLGVVEAGSVSCCLFDKTGTLTTEQLQAIGVQQNSAAGLTSMRELAADAMAHTILCHCHDVARDAEGQWLGDPIEVAALKALGSVSSMEVVKRYAFSPVLRRMTVVCRRQAEKTGQHGGYLALTKGSAEELLPLLLDPAHDYLQQAEQLSAQGYRVLALAYRNIEAGEEDSTEVSFHATRDEVEQQLHFAGFACFGNPLRPEAKEVVSGLTSSDVRNIMVTGDAVTTACYVAREVGMLADGPIYHLEGEHWTQEADSTAGAVSTNPLAEAPALAARGANLVTTEKALQEAGEEAWRVAAQHVAVFARMSPSGKARVVELLRSHLGDSGRADGRLMMVGDGGNDIGALAAADVGLALSPGKQGDWSFEAADFFDDAGAEKRYKAREMKKRKDLMQVREQAAKESAAWLKEKVAAQRDAGQPATFETVWAIIKESRQMTKKAVDAEEGKQAGVGTAACATAPFVGSTLLTIPELLRRGQCTCAGMVMQTQHIVLQTVFGMWCFAALALQGSRPSEVQLTLSGTLLSAAFLGFVNSAAARDPAKVSPPRSLFEPAVLISTLGQAFIHLFVLRQGVLLAKEAMGPAMLQKLFDFEQMAKQKSMAWPPTGLTFEDLRRPFMPNILNSVVFCLELVIDLSVIMVNHKGGPWMRSIGEDPLLVMSIPAGIAIFALCLQGASWVELVPLPPALRRQVAMLSLLAFAGSFVWDRAVEAVFSRRTAAVRRKLPIRVTGLVPFLRHTPRVLSWVVWIGLVLSFNPILWLVAWQWGQASQRQRLQAQEELLKSRPARSVP